MKINIVLPSAKPSGGVRIIFSYANQWVEDGHDVIVYVCPTGAYSLWKKVLIPFIMLKRLLDSDFRGEWFKKNFLVKFPILINNQSIRNADVIIATAWGTSFWVKKLNKLKGKKIYFIQDFETWGDDRQNNRAIESYKLAYDLRISVSTHLHDRLLLETGAESVVVCNGIQSHRISNYRDETCFKRNSVTVGMPYRDKRGVSDDIKNCKTGITVLHKLHNYQLNTIDINLKTFGFSCPDGWDETIEFLVNPSRDQLFSWYDSVDIFYVPSLYEGWGLPIMEAMARGCVVVAGNTGCIYEFGIDHVNCRVLNDMKNVDEATSVILELAFDKKQRSAISNKAIDTVKKYTFEDSAKSFINEIERVVSM